MTDAAANGLKTYLGKLAVRMTLVLLVQSAGLIWWASAITTRMSHVERDVQRVESRVFALEKGPKP